MLRGEQTSLHRSSEKSEADGDTGGDQKSDEHPFFEMSRLRNFALLVEDKRVWVSREFLAELSEVFREFFKGSKEAQNELELPGKKVDEVIELLTVIVPEPDKYQLKPVTCESFLPVSLPLSIIPISLQCHLSADIRKLITHGLLQNHQ